MTPAARLDLTSDAEPLWALRLAAGFELPGRSAVRIAGGNAYRLPSFDDLFAADRGASVGDPNLLPERALEGELGFHAPLARPAALFEGEGAFTVADRVVNLGRGGIAWAKPGEPHGVENRSAGRLVLLVAMGPSPNQR